MAPIVSIPECRYCDVTFDGDEAHDDEAGADVDEVAACGWGIGHPSYPVADRLHILPRNDVRGVRSVLESAPVAVDGGPVAEGEQPVEQDGQIVGGDLHQSTSVKSMGNNEWLKIP